MRTYKTAVVLGCGRSGQAANALLRREGVQTVCACEKLTPDYRFEELPFLPDVAIVSPGFSIDHPWVQELVLHQVPLLSELELGWSRRRCPVIAVTGSNGKSTVVKWITDALDRAGQPAIPCGNYGMPVSEAVLLPDVPDWLVVEVSSFQFETVVRFRPEIGVLLNVLPNHLDRHGTMDIYRKLKLRLFEQMQPGDAAIVPFDFFRDVEPPLQTFPRRDADGRGIRPLVATFGTHAEADYCFSDGRVGTVNVAGTYFDNEILGAAAAAVAAVCDVCELSPAIVEAAARNFEPLPHRAEFVAEINEVRFVDDSKATNLAGMCAALRMAKRPVHLIAGGRAKESDFSFAKDLLVQRVSRLYLIGEASGVMEAAWADSVECVRCGTLEKAVAAAGAHAAAGELVLFSPACTSFDQFRSFKERGEQFARHVRRLKNECENA